MTETDLAVRWQAMRAAERRDERARLNAARRQDADERAAMIAHAEATRHRAAFTTRRMG